MNHHGHLHVETEGPPWATPIAMLHGFTQRGDLWGPLRDELAVIHHLKLVDLPGHGQSDDVRASFEETVHLAGDAGGHATYLGYSMGGRIALGLAVAEPKLVQRLLLLDASPGIVGDDERGARHGVDADLADHLEQIGIDAFLDEWLARPMFAGLDPDAADLAARRTNTARGLGSSLRDCGQGTQPDLRPGLSSIDVPVLLVAGANDEPYVALARETAETIGDGAQVVVIPDAGHAVHLEQPVACWTAIRPWLRETNR